MIDGVILALAWFIAAAATAYAFVQRERATRRETRQIDLMLEALQQRRRDHESNDAAFDRVLVVACRKAAASMPPSAPPPPRRSWAPTVAQ